MLTRVVAANYLHLENCTRKHYNPARYYGPTSLTYTSLYQYQCVLAVAVFVNKESDYRKTYSHLYYI